MCESVNYALLIHSLSNFLRFTACQQVLSCIPSLVVLPYTGLQSNASVGRGKKEGAKADATRIELVIAIGPSYAVITLRRDAQENSTWFAYSGMVSTISSRHPAQHSTSLQPLTKFNLRNGNLFNTHTSTIT